MSSFEMHSEIYNPSSFAPLKRQNGRHERTYSSTMDHINALRHASKFHKRNNNIHSITSNSSNNNSTLSISSNHTVNTSTFNDNPPSSTLIASYSSAKLAPPVSAASVEAFERRFPDQRPWYTIHIHPCHITIPGSGAMPIPRKSYSIYRRFEDVQDFAERLENEFPWIRLCSQEGSLKTRNILAINLRDKSSAWPRMRSRANSTITDTECIQRKSDLDKYLQSLFALGPIISQCRLVAEFFGIWKTDLEANLSQEIQDPLALYSLVTRPFESTAKTVLNSPTSNVDLSPATSVHVSRKPALKAIDSQLACPLWSPPLSSCSSTPTSPSMSPTHNRNGSHFPWEISSPSPLGDTLPMNNQSLPSPPSSSYHGSDNGEDEESEDEFESSLEDQDGEDSSSFEIAPSLRGIKKSTSLQNLRRDSRGDLDLSAYENNPQKWQFQEGSFPGPKDVVNMRPRTRRPSSFDTEEIQCFNARLSETSLQSKDAPPSFTTTSKTPFASKSGHLITSPLMRRPRMKARTMSESKTDGSAYPYTMTEPPNMTRRTSPFSSTATLPSSAFNSTKFKQGGLKRNEKSFPISAPIMVFRQTPLTKPLEQDCGGARMITMQEQAKMSYAQQRELEIASFPMPPMSIPKNGTRIMTPNPNHDLRSGVGFLNGIKGKRHGTIHRREREYTRATSPIRGSGFLSQHPSAFVATFKIVVDAEWIIALQVMEKDEDFMLSVPDLRLRVRNKFARMEMPIPEDFELIWTPWHGEKVVLKNDEELQRAIYSSANNKVTLQCMF